MQRLKKQNCKRKRVDFQEEKWAFWSIYQQVQEFGPTTSYKYVKHVRLLSFRKEEKGASQEQFWGNLKSRPHGSRNTGGRRYDKWATNSTRGVQPPRTPALHFSPPGSLESAGFDHKTPKSMWEKLRNPVAALDERIPHIGCSWFWMHSQDRTYHILHSDGEWTMTPPHNVNTGSFKLRKASRYFPPQTPSTGLEEVFTCFTLVKTVQKYT